MMTMSDGRRQWVEARIQQWQRQFRDIVAMIERYVDDNQGAPDHLSNELSRLSWLIQHGKAELRMSRIMYDSTDPNNIPAGAEIVAYYPHAWGTDLSKHHLAIQVRIDNRGDHADDCHVLDVEAGAASVTTAVEWVASWHKLHPQGLSAVNGYFDLPTIYASESTWVELYKALPANQFYAWVAWWTGTPTVLHDSVAHQYINYGPNGENYDVSSVYDDAWGLTFPKPPTPAPAPPPVVEQFGALVTYNNSPTPVMRLAYSRDGGTTWTLR